MTLVKFAMMQVPLVKMVNLGEGLIVEIIKRLNEGACNTEKIVLYLEILSKLEVDVETLRVKSKVRCRCHYSYLTRFFFDTRKQKLVYVLEH